MTFTLTIELGNDAMQNIGDVKKAITDALHRRIGREGIKTEAGDGGRIMDVNGNGVGTWEVTE